MSTVSNSVNSVNSVNSYSAVLPPSPMVFLSKVTFRDPWRMMMMKMMVTGMVVAAGESLRMTSSGQPFACEDRARCPPAEEKAATESSRQRAFHQPTIHLPLSSSNLLTAST